MKPELHSIKTRVAIIHDDFSISGGGEKLVSVMADQLTKRGMDAEIYTFNTSENTEKMVPAGTVIHKIRIDDPELNDDTVKRYLFSELNLKGKYDFFIFSGHSSICAARANKPNLLYCHNIPKSEPSFRRLEMPGEEKDLRDMIVNNKDDVQIYLSKNKKLHPVEKTWRWLFDIKMKYIKKPILPEGLANKVDALRFLISRKISLRNYKFLTYHLTHKENLLEIERIFVNSKNIQEKVLSTYKRNSEIVYPPIEVDKYFFAEHEHYWLSVNRVVPLKRIEMQLRAFANLPNEKLLIIGDLENKDYYRYLDKIKPTNVTFLGMVSEEEKIKKLSHCKGFIFTAEDEDFGMSPVEAMASGKPVIAPNEGGCKETIVHGKTGFLIDNINDHKIYEAIAATNLCFDDDPHYFKDACRTRAELFDVSHFISKIEQAVTEGVVKR